MRSRFNRAPYDASGLSFLHYAYLAIFAVTHAADQRSTWLSPCILLSVAAGESRNHSPVILVGSRVSPSLP
jgi:hypothetical protein